MENEGMKAEHISARLMKVHLELTGSNGVVIWWLVMHPSRRVGPP